MALLALGIAILTAAQATLVPGLPPNVLVSAVAVQGGRLLIGTEDKGLWVLSKVKAEAEPISGPGAGAVALTILSGDGRAFIGTRDSRELSPYASAGMGVWTVGSGQMKARPVTGLPKDALLESVASSDGRTVLGTYKSGLWAIENLDHHALRVAGPREDGYVRFIWTNLDRLLIASWAGDIWTLTSNQTAAKPVTASDPEGAPGALCHAHVGSNTFIGTSCFGLWVLPDSSSAVSKVKGVPTDDVVRCVLPIGKTALIGTRTGLYSIEPGEGAASKVPGFPELPILNLLQVGSTTYIGTDMEGLYARSSPNEKAALVTGFPKDNGIFRLVAMGPYAVAWGSDRGSDTTLYIVDRRVAKPVQLPPGAIVTDVEYWQNRAWIATSKGLYSLTLPQ